MENEYRIEIKARYKALSKYDIFIEVGMFNSRDEQIGFLKDVQKWNGKETAVSFQKTLTLNPCHRAMVYLFIVPKVVPESTLVHAPGDFSLKITGFCNREKILYKKYAVNEWAGTNLEIELKAV